MYPKRRTKKLVNYCDENLELNYSETVNPTKQTKAKTRKPKKNMAAAPKPSNPPPEVTDTVEETLNEPLADVEDFQSYNNTDDDVNIIHDFFPDHVPGPRLTSNQLRGLNNA